MVRSTVFWNKRHSIVQFDTAADNPTCLQTGGAMLENVGKPT